MPVAGFVYWGKVDELKNQCIRTKVMVCEIPLLTTSSMLVFGDDSKSVRGIKIPLYWKSVAAIYLRFYGWLPALLFIHKMNPLVNDNWLEARISFGVYLACYLMGAFWIVGRIPHKKRLEYLLFGKITGYYRHPKIFPRAVAAEILAENQRRFDLFQLTPDPAAWGQQAPPLEIIPFLHVYAAYQYASTRDQRWLKIEKDTYATTISLLRNPNSDILK